MPSVQTNGIKLHYESQGHGPPLLLISGVGFGGWVWHQQVPAFSERFQMITFDNRGVGRSDKPDEPYSIELFVADALGLLEALQIERTHLLGVSLGGMIALQLALDHPRRVDHLLLCSTTFGGPQTVLPQPEVLQFMAQPGGRAEERFQKGFQLSCGPGFVEAHPDELAFLRQQMSENRQPDYAYRHQIMAPLGFNVEARLTEIRQPTLVLAGEADQVIPSENARRLAQKLPDAQLKVLPGAGHLCFIEEPEAFNRAVLDFLGGTR